MKSVVTLTNWSLESVWRDDPNKVESLLKSEIAKIKTIQEAFRNAANKHNEDCPLFVLSTLMMPDWDAQSDYGQESYQLRQNSYLSLVNKICNELGVDIHVKDFYKEATEHEKQFLHECRARGSCADIMKNRSIIDNIGNKHLNIDTNTVVNDLHNFYMATFGSQKQKDGFNAAYYDNNYISVHNKVVYTAPDSEFAKMLQHVQQQYMLKKRHDKNHKQARANTLYSIVFSEAANRVGLSERNRKYFPSWNNLWSCYPAVMTHRAYDMTRYIVTAINMSWSQGPGKVEHGALKKIKPITMKYNNAVVKVDFPVFNYIVKKRCNPLLAGETRESLLTISDQEFDDSAIKAFFERVIEKYDVGVVADLLASIPNTQQGDNVVDFLLSSIVNKDAFAEKLSKCLNSEHTSVTVYQLQVLERCIKAAGNTLGNIKPEMLQKKQKKLLVQLSKMFRKDPRYASVERQVQFIVKRIKQQNKSLRKKQKKKQGKKHKGKYKRVQRSIKGIKEILRYAPNRLAVQTIDQLFANVYEELRSIDNIFFKEDKAARLLLSMLPESTQQRFREKIFDTRESFYRQLKGKIIQQEFYNQQSIITAIDQLNALAGKQPEELTAAQEAQVQKQFEVLRDAKNSAELTAIAKTPVISYMLNNKVKQSGIPPKKAQSKHNKNGKSRQKKPSVHGGSQK